MDIYVWLCGCIVVVTQRRYTNHHLVEVTPCHKAQKACILHISLYNPVLCVQVLSCTPCTFLNFVCKGTIE